MFSSTQRSSYLALGIIILYMVLLAALSSALHSQGHTLSDFSLKYNGDAFGYFTLGHSILFNHSFTLDGIHPQFFRTPGYPLFIACILFFSNSVLAVVCVQIFLVAGTAYFIERIGAQLFSTWVGITAALLYVLDPTTILTAFSTLSDTLFVFLLFGMVLLIVTKSRRVYRKAIVLGLIGGYLTLVRPVGEFIVPILILWYIVSISLSSASQESVSRALSRDTWLRALKTLACMVIAMFVVLVPWMTRNLVEGEHFSLSTIGPYNFLFYNTVEYEVAKGEGTRESLNDQFQQELGTTSETALEDFSYTRQITMFVKQNLETHLLSYMEFHIVKSIPFYIGSSIEINTQTLYASGALSGSEAPIPNISGLILNGYTAEALKDLAANPFGLLERLFWIAVLFFDVIAIIFAKGSKRITLIFFALLALAFGLLTGPVSFPRYRLPAEPFLLLAAAAGAGLLFTYLRGLYNTSAKAPKLILELVKYFAASLIALVVDVGILVLLASCLHVYYLLAAFISFVAGIAVIYFLSIRYVFEDRPLGTSKGKEFLFFLLIGGVGLLINELVLWCCTGIFGVHYLVSKLISVVFVFAWNYVARKALLFSSTIKK